MAQVEHLGDGAGLVSWKWLWSCILEMVLVECLGDGASRVYWRW